MTSPTEVTAAVAAALAAPRCRTCGRPMTDRWCRYSTDVHEPMAPEVQAAIDALTVQAAELRTRMDAARSHASGNDTATNRKRSGDSSAFRKARAAYEAALRSIETVQGAVGYASTAHYTRIDELCEQYRREADAAWRRRARLMEAEHLRSRAAELKSPEKAGPLIARAEHLEQLAAEGDGAPPDENDGA